MNPHESSDKPYHRQQQHEPQQQHDHLPWSTYDQTVVENLLLAQDPPSTPSSFEPTYDGDHQQLSPMCVSLFAGYVRSRKSDEERRLRHRAAQQRFMQRKKDAIANTKRLAQELEQKYQLLEIEAEKKRLKEENQHIAAQLASTVPLIPTKAQIAILLNEKMTFVRRYFEPLAVATWTRTLKKSVREYDVSHDDPRFMTSGLSVMGWRDLRKLENETLTFVLSKEFLNTDAEDLMNRTYTKLTTPDTYACFYNPFFDIKMQVLQRIDDDNIIIHRATFVPQTCHIAHGLVMFSRVHRDEGFLIIGHALENNPVQQRLGMSWRWTDVTTWLEFLPSHSSNKGSKGCLFRCGGQMRQFVARTAAYWMMEVFFMVLRYESNMVAPVFSITSE